VTAQQRLRVLVITIVHDPEDARIRYRQIPALMSAGHSVLYAAPFAAFARTPPTGVRAITLPRATGRDRLSAIWAARRLIRRFGCTADIILLHDPDLLLAVLGLGGRVGPIVWDVHEDTAAALSMRAWIPTFLRRPFAGAVRLAEQFAERHYHLILAEHSYRERFRTDHPVVPNSVLVPRARPEAPGTDRVVYLGKINTPRGGAQMLELARAVPELRIQLIGPADPDVRDQVRGAAEVGLVEWIDFLPNHQALASLPGALAGIALLHDERNYSRSLPTKLVEYMAHGLPVITTSNEAAAALVTDSGGGIVVPFGDTAAVAEALRTLAASGDSRITYGSNGYGYVAQHMNWHRDGPAFVRVLEDFASGASRSP